jgi:hypothetical protein
VVAVSLAPLEAAGVGLPPMHPLSRKDPPSAAPPKSKLRRVKVAAGSCAVGCDHVNGAVLWPRTFRREQWWTHCRHGEPTQS